MIIKKEHDEYVLPKEYSSIVSIGKHIKVSSRDNKLYAVMKRITWIKSKNEDVNEVNIEYDQFEMYM